MCFGGPPSPPPLPEPRPTPPKPEKTAERVVVSTNRTDPSSTGKKRTNQRTSRARRLGTAMLRIPLTDNQGSSDLRY